MAENIYGELTGGKGMLSEGEMLKNGIYNKLRRKHLHYLRD